MLGFAVQDGHFRGIPLYQNSLHCIKSIMTDEGLRGLYAGLTPTLIGSGKYLKAVSQPEYFKLIRCLYMVNSEVLTDSTPAYTK